jgi:linoleate 10R-lipoxygenase
LDLQYIAQKILDINEWGTYSNPAEENRRIAQDDEIFNRAKLVNCGFFIQIVLGDYVGGILGFSRDGNPWRLNLVEVSNRHLLELTGSSLLRCIFC